MQNHVHVLALKTKESLYLIYLLKGAAQKYTQFTGNKAPCSNKECVLIYDTKTKEFTIERLQTNIILKKSR